MSLGRNLQGEKYLHSRCPFREVHSHTFSQEQLVTNLSFVFPQDPIHLIKPLVGGYTSLLSSRVTFVGAIYAKCSLSGDMYMLSRTMNKTVQRNEELIHATIWLSLENVMLPESETQKATYCVMKFI